MWWRTPKQFEAVLAFDNPVSRWQLSSKHATRPPERDVLLAKWFRSELMARAWLNGATAKLNNTVGIVVNHGSPRI